MMRWAAARNVTHVPRDGAEHGAHFAAWLICLSLGIFIVWALSSWVLSDAACWRWLRGAALPSGLRRACGGAADQQLVEINLVLGIVKLALIVLAMVFSAFRCRSRRRLTGRALYIWCGGRHLVYLAASDFFQVARLAAFMELWQRDRSPRSALQIT